MSQKKLKQILVEYCDGLRIVLGEALDSVVLYGSRARDEAREDSDIDVLCVMRDPFDYGALIEKTSRLTADLSLAHDVVLSRTFAERADFETRQTPFLMNVRREGSVH